MSLNFDEVEVCEAGRCRQMSHRAPCVSPVVLWNIPVNTIWKKSYPNLPNFTQLLSVSDEAIHHLQLVTGGLFPAGMLPGLLPLGETSPRELHFI